MTIHLDTTSPFSLSWPVSTNFLCKFLKVICFCGQKVLCKFFFGQKCHRKGKQCISTEITLIFTDFCEEKYNFCAASYFFAQAQACMLVSFRNSVCTSLDYYDPWEHLEQAWQTNKTWKEVDFDFSSERKLIPKWGLDNATTDEFAKMNKVKQTTKMKNNNPTKIQTQRLMLKHNNIPSCDLSGKSLWTGSLLE